MPVEKNRVSDVTKPRLGYICEGCVAPLVPERVRPRPLQKRALLLPDKHVSCVVKAFKDSAFAFLFLDE